MTDESVSCSNFDSHNKNGFTTLQECQACQIPWLKTLDSTSISPGREQCHRLTAAGPASTHPSCSRNWVGTSNVTSVTFCRASWRTISNIRSSTNGRQLKLSLESIHTRRNVTGVGDLIDVHVWKDDIQKLSIGRWWNFIN